ncbi:MAG: hypothetical protein JOY80_10660 [Candidatus Dormibacteraeota bacterium]|nr:hypothetical protein [Candidatus Dormibacteraeota bacterium]
MELFALHLNGRGQLPAPRTALDPLFQRDGVAEALGSESAITFEPGGQIEFSTEPQPATAQLESSIERDVSAARAALDGSDVVFIACGTDPFPGRITWPLAVDSPRYRVMEEHFDALGPRGRQMMRQTSALQICVETSPAAIHDTWLVLNRAGPALSALFANSPVLAGTRSGEANERLSVWLDTDSSRTGFDGAQIGTGDPIDAYTRFAVDALAMPLPRNGRSQPTPGTLSFAEWLALTPEADDDDVEHHLSTLFPPVRPRGAYLEVRYVDALPLRWAAVALLVLTTLAHDDRARRKALDVLPADACSFQAWQNAIRYGIRDRALAERGALLLDIVIEALTAADGSPSRRVQQYRERFLDAGRAPGDDLDDLLRLEPAKVATWI